jgi:exodeoxyribonuclease V gamma subunit
MAGDGSIRVYRSHRAEVLLDAVCDIVAQPLADPLAPEWLVVQGRGMATWMSSELAGKLGIWANADMLYPRNFVQRVIAHGLGCEASPAYAEGSLPWVVLACLEEHLDTPPFGQLARYLQSDPDGMRRWQLACAIGRCFDEYLSYRPDRILAWEQNGDPPEDEAERWQCLLWRSIRRRLGGEHIAARAAAFVERLASDETSDEANLAADGWPERVCIFGLSSIPPIYVRVIAGLCHRTEVHMFLLSPCQDYWAESVTPEQALRSIEAGAAPEWLHLDGVHPLLASLGAHGAAFGRLFDRELEAAACAVIEPQETLFRPSQGDSVLLRLQASILGAEPADRAPMTPEARARDDSVTVHACHSPMREVEVLRDQLLDMLTDGSDLRPEDVVVMMPDVEAYAPLIEAVLAVDRSDPRFIPHHIADRSLRSDAPVIDALDRLLSLVTSRVTSSEVVDFLRLDVVCGRFGIEQRDIDTIVQWLADSGVRWGIDRAHRSEHGMSDDEQNTWKFGLDRLLLGYAMPTGERATFGGVLPYDEIEGGAAVLLGRFAAFCDALFATLRGCRAARSIDAWQRVLSKLLSEFFVSDGDTSWQHERVVAAVSQLCEVVKAAGFDSDVTLSVLRAWVSSQLEGAAAERGFLSGGVTFCAMLPMRSIPFRVVYLLGMNDGAFPRQTRRVDFDIMRPPGVRDGDRNRRDDDRYLFLEALLSARQRLVLSYCGQSVNDDSTRPPSVVLSELLDHLRSEHHDPAAEPCQPPVAMREEDRGIAQVLPRLVIRHPLQPFSARYVDGIDDRLFRYAAEPQASEPQASEPQASEPQAAPAEPHFGVPLFERPLSPPSDPSEDVDLAELITFYRDPIVYLLTRRLRVALQQHSAETRDTLPLQMRGLEAYQVGARLLAWGKHDAASTLTRLRATGDLPPAQIGQIAAQDLQDRAGAIRAIAEELRGASPRQSESLRVRLPSGQTIHGIVPDVYDDGVVSQQFADVSAKHVLSLWIRHLMLSAAAPERLARGSAVVGRSGKTHTVSHFAEPAVAALERLDDLVKYYHLGQREPLLLLPAAAFAYTQQLHTKKDEAAALKSARTALGKDRRHQQLVAPLFEGIDLLLADRHPLGASFESPRFAELATCLLLPLQAQVNKR